MTSIAWGEGPTLTEEERQSIETAAAERKQKDSEVARRREVRRHPIYLAVRNARSTRPVELDTFDLSDADRQKVDAAIAEVKEVHASGAHQESDNVAHERAFEIVEALPEHQRTADYLVGEQLDTRGPRELAEAVPSW